MAWLQSLFSLLRVQRVVPLGGSSLLHSRGGKGTQLVKPFCLYELRPFPAPPRPDSAFLGKWENALELWSCLG
jgi:hypothetical protein